MKLKQLQATVLAAWALWLLAPVQTAFAAGLEDEKEPPAAEKDDEKKEDEDRWFALVHAEIHTGTGSVLYDASLLAKNGVIEEIGHDLFLPEGTEVLNVQGQHVYPGLVAIGSAGLFGGSNDIKNTVNPFGSSMTLGLAGGVTSALQGNEVGKLKRGEIEGVLVSSKVFADLSYSTSNPKGKRSLRESFEDAVQYMRDYAQWETDVKKDKELKAPKKLKDMTPVSILRGEILPRFRSNARGDLLEIANLATRFGFRPVIEGCSEGWTVADELGRAGAMAIVTPRQRRAKQEQLVRPGGSSIENASILHKAGVPIALVPFSKNINLGGIVGRDLMHLTIEAGFAVRGGLSEEAALAGITIVPARMMGLDHRIGSIEVGKDCDLIVADGDILHYQTFVQWAVVDGKLVYDKEDELYFAHIRPRPESALAPLTKVDAGEEEEAAEAGAAEPDEGDE